MSVNTHSIVEYFSEEGIKHGLLKETATKFYFLPIEHPLKVQKLPLEAVRDMRTIENYPVMKFIGIIERMLKFSVKTHIMKIILDGYMNEYGELKKIKRRKIIRN